MRPPPVINQNEITNAAKKVFGDEAFKDMIVHRDGRVEFIINDPQTKRQALRLAGKFCRVLHTKDIKGTPHQIDVAYKSNDQGSLHCPVVIIDCDNAKRVLDLAA